MLHCLQFAKHCDFSGQTSIIQHRNKQFVDAASATSSCVNREEKRGQHHVSISKAHQCQSSSSSCSQVASGCFLVPPPSGESLDRIMTGAGEIGSYHTSFCEWLQGPGGHLCPCPTFPDVSALFIPVLHNAAGYFHKAVVSFHDAVSIF